MLLGSLCSLAWCAPPLAASCVCCGGAPRDHRLGIHAARLALRLPLLLEAGASVTTVSAGVRQGSRASVGMCARARVCVTSSAVPSRGHCVERSGRHLVDEHGARWRPCGVGFLDFTFPHARVQMDCNANAGAPAQPNSKESLAMGALHQSRAPPSGVGAGEGGGLRTRRGVSLLVVSRQRVACMCARCVACLCVGVLVCVCQRLEMTLFRAVQMLFRTTRVEQGCAGLWGTASLGYFSVSCPGML